jgi:hypothetical protein
VGNYDWSPADTRACDALARAGTLKYDRPTTVVDVINAAREAERKHIQTLIGSFIIDHLESK